MFFLSLKIALRNFLKNKGFFLINILGLTIGLSVALVIFLWTYTELSYDRFNSNFKRIYEFKQRIYLEKEKYTSDRCGGLIGPELSKNFPEIKSFVRFGTLNGEVLLSYIPPDSSQQRINIIENKGLATDSTVFRVFTFPLLKGNPSRALVQKNSIVLSQKEAIKFFGKTDPVGKTLLLNDHIPLEVTGILKQVPINSSIQFDFLLPFSLLPDITWVNDSYEGTNYNTFFLLNENADYSLLNKKIPVFLKNIHKSQLEYDPFIIPLKSVHLHDEKRAYIGVYSFVAIAVMILLTACINFINLTTARSMDRAKEVGIKKTIGARKIQLIRQFLIETFMLTMAALFLAVILTEFVVPLFNRDFNTQINIDFLNYKLILAMVLLLIITSLLSGVYPAALLSSFNPAQALKNIRKTNRSGARLRKILVITQFVVSIFCILCTTILVFQLKHILNSDPGFNRENLIIVPARGKLMDKTEIVKQALLSDPSIMDVTSASELPDNVMYGDIDWGKADHKENKAISRFIYVDYDFVKTFQIKMKAGRFYSRDFPSDSTQGMVISQAVADHMGYKDPVGQPFYLHEKKYTIIGIIGDFNFFPINMGGKAIFLPLSEKNNYLFIRYRAGSLESAIRHLTDVCSHENPNYPPEYYLFNEYDRLVLRIAGSSNTMLKAITPLALFISCLGLIGLSIYTAEVKTKEIGIRKIFGASSLLILYDLLKDFGLLILISIFIAMPLVYILMNFVLNFFSMRISISPLLFIVSAILLFMLTFMVTGWQAYKAATKNPVLSLRYE